MPEVEIILNLKPNDLNSLNIVDYPLGLFERLAQVLKIQMQFELTAEGILVFFKTRADFDKVLQAINQALNNENPALPPSDGQSVWECMIVKSGREDRIALLKLLENKLYAFLGRFGTVKLQDERVKIKLPKDFRLHPYFQSADFTHNQQ